MTLECILLGERSQTQKAISHMKPFTGYSGKDNFTGTENKSMAARS